MSRKFVFGFIILGLVLRAYLMRDVAFYDWDEGFYAEVAQEILSTKSLQARFNGEIWLDKPALSHYQVAAIFALTNDPELYSRMLMVFYASVMLVMTYLLNRRLLQHFFSEQLAAFSSVRKEIVYFLPVLVTASTPLFLERSTQLNTDIMLSVAWLGYFLTYKNYWSKLFFICFGTFTKSLVGLYPLGFEILNTKSWRVTRKGVLKTLGLIILPLSWHIYSFIRYSETFIQEHVYDQVIKRVMVPIELHFGFMKLEFFGKEYEFGEKVFYPLIAWLNFNVLILVLAAAFLVITYDLLDLGHTKLRFRALLDRLSAVYKSDDWMNYLILFSAVPFFILLAFSKSKISWYFTTIIPLFALTIPYLYMRLKSKHLQKLLLVVVVALFLYRFIPQTYALKVTSDNRHDRIQIAQCIRTLPVTKVAMLVDAQERQTHNVLEAAHLQAKSSFIHGGSTSFVYYSEKKINFYYKVDEFVKDFAIHSLVIISKTDIDSVELTDVKDKLKGYNKETRCYFGPWEVYTKR